MVVHHPAKGDGSSQSLMGAGELSADLDANWSLTAGDDDEREVRCIKDRDGDLEKAMFAFTIQQRDDGSVVLDGSSRRQMSPRNEAEETVLGLSPSADSPWEDDRRSSAADEKLPYHASVATAKRPIDKPRRGG